MTATDAPSNTKAGWSSYCRRDQHRTCTTLQARCACDCHGKAGQTPPETATPRPKETRMPEPARPLQSVPDTPKGPRFQAVKETPPPATVGVKPLHERIHPFLTEVKQDPGDWYRISTYPKKSSANSAQTSLKKAQTDGKLDKKWVFAARTLDDGSALYACYGTPKADG